MIKDIRNDTFFTCSIIEKIGRETKNTRQDVVTALGNDLIKKIYDLADIYHCLSVEEVVDEFVRESGLKNGNFDNIKTCFYDIPTYWEIGRVYHRLVLAVASKTKKEIPETIISVFSSRISEGIQNFNSAWYYTQPEEHLSEYFTPTF